MAFIFVYGTLMKVYRELNAFTKVFHEGTEWISKATIPGKLYRLDWYPALILQGTEPVYGEVYRITSPSLLAILDQYEHAIPETDYQDKLKQNDSFIDADYIRRKITVNKMECWVYEYIGSVSEESRITSGLFQL